MVNTALEGERYYRDNDDEQEGEVDSDHVVPEKPGAVQEEDPQGEVVKKRKNKIVARPLTLAEIRDPERGLAALRSACSDFKTTGNGRELKDLNRLLKRVHGWQRCMAPRLSLIDTIEAFDKSTSGLKRQDLGIYLRELREEEYRRNYLPDHPKKAVDDNDLEMVQSEDDPLNDNNGGSKLVSGENDVSVKERIRLNKERAVALRKQKLAQAQAAEQAIQDTGDEDMVDEALLQAMEQKAIASSSQQKDLVPASCERAKEEANAYKEQPVHKKQKRKNVIDSDDEDSESEKESVDLSTSGAKNATTFSEDLESQAVNEQGQQDAADDEESQTQVVDNPEWTQQTQALTTQGTQMTQMIGNEDWTQNEEAEAEAEADL